MTEKEDAFAVVYSERCVPTVKEYNEAAKYLNRVHGCSFKMKEVKDKKEVK